MNLLLWILQLVLAALFLIGGAAKVFFVDEMVGPQHLASAAALPHAGWVALGLFEMLCALGLLLPAVLRGRQRVAQIAALCLAIEALLIAGLHAVYAEAGSAVASVLLAAAAAFIAYGRRVRNAV